MGMENNLYRIKNKLLTGDLNVSMYNLVNSMCLEKKRPLGKLNPWAWWIELVRGCNLACDFCPTRLFKPGDIKFMDKTTWISLLNVIQEVSPYSRLEIGNAGEPLLHPYLTEFFCIARETCPNLQLMTYTNGTSLINGHVTYKELFEAGLNMICVDMYDSFDDHKKLAEESGYKWYHRDHKPDNMPSIFRYQNNKDIHIIMFSENPYNWPSLKVKLGRLHTFLNELDWRSARSFGLKPVQVPPGRKCDFPWKFPSVNYDGTFVFCCLDFLRHTVNKFGNISDGVEGFINYWLSEYMQYTRFLLSRKDRISHEFCSKCSFISPRADISYWDDNAYQQYWDGDNWVNSVNPLYQQSWEKYNHNQTGKKNGE